MAQKTLVIDLDRCNGCLACEVACKLENNVPLGIYYNKVLDVGPIGKFPNVKEYFLPGVCQVCKDAPCVSVCPTKATYRTEDGQIMIDKEKCIGCKACMTACPYGARSFNAKTGKVEKCTLCHHLQEIGEKPACVKVCTAKARFFGDLDDPNSDVSKAIKAAGAENVHSLRDYGNKPTVRYIMHKKTAPWQDNLVNVLKKE